MDTEFMDAKKNALRLLGFRARSTAEMRKRLAMKRTKPEIIDRVIESLEKEGFLNDESFAASFAESRMRSRPEAKRVIEWELKQKGLSKDAMAGAMAQLAGFDEKEVARELCLSKMPSLKSLPPLKKRVRLFGLLKRRGFSNDVASSVLNDVLNQTQPIED